MSVHLSGVAGAWTLDEGEHVLGRDQRCRLRIADGRLSRQHARFVVQGEAVTIIDLGSANGVLLNGDRIRQPTRVHDGDAIVCGPCLFQVRIDGTSEPATAIIPPSPEALPGQDRVQTEAMDPVEMARLATPPSQVGRGLDPGIVAALTSSGLIRPPPLGKSAGKPPAKSGDTSQARVGLEPSDIQPATSGALSRHPGPMTMPGSTPVGRDGAGLLPSDARPVTDALTSELFPSQARSAVLRWRRLTAGVLETASIAGLLLLTTLPLVLTGLAAALVQAGAALDQGEIRFGHGDAAGFTDLLGALLMPSQWLHLGAWLLHLRTLPDQGPFLIAFAGCAGAVIVAEAVLIIGLVAGTVRHGAPWWHRRLGLIVVDRRTGYRLSWMQASMRWFLAGALLPTGLVTSVLEVRSLADRLCRSEIRRG